jgi:hypothetical protein
VISNKATHLAVPLRRDRWFESGSLHQRVYCDMMTGALMLPPTRSGITEASTTRSRSIPKTRNSPSTTAMLSLWVRANHVGIAIARHRSTELTQHAAV